MTNVKYVLLAAVLSASSSATAFTAEEKNCNAGIYCADQVVCISRIQGTPPRGMASDWYVEVVTMRAFKSTKNLGGGRKGLVDSLVMSTNAAGDTPQITMEQAKASVRDFNSGTYGPPARIRGKKVSVSWSPTSNYSNGLNLTIVSSQNMGSYRLDKLTGSEKIVGDVVPNHSRIFECEAQVVAAPSRIDDLTR